MSGDLTPSFVRTLVPIVVGPLAARFMPGIDPTDPTVLLLVSGVISYLYYVAVRVIEMEFPKMGYFLGIAKAPAYSQHDAPSPGVGEHVEAVVVEDATDETEQPLTIRKVPVKRRRRP